MPAASTARVVVLVEGASDAAVVASLCAAGGVDLDAVEVRDMGGVTNLGHHLRALDGTRAMLGLYDAPEEWVVLRALQRAGRAVSDRAGLERLGFWVCNRDLEEELIRALGPSRVEEILADLGDLDRFRAFQAQPQWRGRDLGDQLRRFAGTASGRKLLLARRLADELTPATTPPALRGLVEGVRAAVTA
jgi:hypothetical protein